MIADVCLLALMVVLIVVTVWLILDEAGKDGDE